MNAKEQGCGKKTKPTKNNPVQSVGERKLFYNAVGMTSGGLRVQTYQIT